MSWRAKDDGWQGLFGFPLRYCTAQRPIPEWHKHRTSQTYNHSVYLPSQIQELVGTRMVEREKISSGIFLVFSQHRGVATRASGRRTESYCGSETTALLGRKSDCQGPETKTVLLTIRM